MKCSFKAIAIRLWSRGLNGVPPSSASRELTLNAQLEDTPVPYHRFMRTARTHFRGGCSTTGARE